MRPNARLLLLQRRQAQLPKKIRHAVSLYLFNLITTGRVQGIKCYVMRNWFIKTKNERKRFAKQLLRNSVCDHLVTDHEMCKNAHTLQQI